MKKSTALIVAALTLVVCSSAVLLTTSSAPIPTQTKAPVEGLSYNYTVRTDSKQKDFIWVDATLKNNSSKSIYLFTYTCDQWVGFLEYDTATMVRYNKFFCNASFPEVVELKSRETSTYEFHFKINKPVTEIELGLRYYPVNKDFETDLNNIKGLKSELIPAKKVPYTLPK